MFFPATNLHLWWIFSWFSHYNHIKTSIFHGNFQYWAGDTGDGMRLAVFPSPSTPKTQLERVEQTDPHITHIYIIIHPHCIIPYHPPLECPCFAALRRARNELGFCSSCSPGSTPTRCRIARAAAVPPPASAAAEAAITSPHLLNALRRGNGSWSGWEIPYKWKF